MTTPTRRPMWRAAVAALAGTLAMGGAVALAASSAAVEGFAFERLRGDNRYITAAEIARDSFTSSQRAVLASGGERNFPDALTGNYLAGFADAPILLTEPARLPAPTLQALRDLGVQRVTIVGGTSAVSSGVQRELTDAGFTVDRIAGDDRYDTAARVGGTVPTSYVGSVGGRRTAILGNGQDFPDILAASPASFEAALPTTITRPNDLPAETENELKALNIQQVIIVGGVNAVSTSVENEVRQFVPTVRRIAGSGRFETARDFANFEIDELGFADTHINLARSDKFPDALAGGPHAGRDRAPIILTTPGTLATAAADFLETRDCTLRDGHIFGGFAAISQAVEDRAEEIARTCEGGGPSPSPTPSDTATATISVTPDTAEMRTVTSNPDNTTEDNRTYQVAGLESGETYRITLVRCENIQGSGSDATFLGESDPNSSTGVSAATGTPSADITSVNGQARADADPAAGFQSGTTTFVASGTTASFVVDGDNANECIRPVVYFDSSTADTTEGGSSPRLELQGPAGQFSRPAEDFDTGGATTFVSFGSATVRPELQTASVVSTGSDGTTVRYEFDETVTLGDLAQFQVYLANGTLADAEGESATVSGNVVLVRFAGVTTTSSTNPLTLATVDIGAVRDLDSRANPEGDAPLGTVEGQTQPAGITVAPDLVSVGNFRPGTTTGTTAVDFTFDEPAFVVDPGGFAIIRNDGEEFRGSPRSDSGTVTITVDFTNEDRTTANPGGTPFTSANIARGTVDDATVSDAPQVVTGANPEPIEGNPNVLQAADVGNSGNTTFPDLVSVDLRPNANVVAGDAALYTFDEPVEVAVAENFRLYKTTGQFVTGDSAEILESDPRQVLVQFSEPDAAVNAVGGNVLDGAVFQTAAGAAPLLEPAEGPNQQDEVGIVDTAANDATIPGRTDSPDLVAVRLAAVNNAFEATYVFDEPVGANAPREFLLYQSGGTRLVATTCATGGDNTGNDRNDNTVTCTAYVVDANDNGVADTGEPQATSAQIGSTTLGAVDNGAVLAADNAAANPEGAEFTSGGTGTRTT